MDSAGCPPGVEGIDDQNNDSSQMKRIVAQDLCASFPNLASLEPLPEPVGETLIPELPPDLLHGKLSNGLAYYVMANSEPKKRVELHLVVGFGSLSEEEDQRGGAHIIEHLGFSATKNYANHDLVKILESIGAGFGACQNAYTGYDRTVYHLHVACDDWEIVTKSLSVLREFAFWTRISQEDVDKERHVVLDEWRRSKSASGRLMESYAKAISKGSLYEVRMPIGTEEVIKTCPAERLRDFYLRHYHPQHMALVAIGDCDPNKMAASIRELFDMSVEEIGRAPTAPERPDPEIPLHTQPRFVLSEDPELAMSVVLIENVRPRRPPMRTVADFEECMAEKLFSKALNNRLYKVTMRPDSIVFSASLSMSSFCPAIEGMQVSISPAEGKIMEAMLIVLTEVERVKLFGFHEDEVQRAKRALFADFEESYIERNQTPSGEFASELSSYHLEGQPAPGILFEARMARAVLTSNSLDADCVSKVAHRFDPWGNTVYKIAAPRKTSFNPFRKRSSFREADVVAVLEQLRNLRDTTGALEPWPKDADDVSTRLQRLFEKAQEQQGSEIERENADTPSVRHCFFGEPFGTGAVDDAAQEDDGDDNTIVRAGQPLGEEVTLSNGMSVFLRRSDLLDDEILFRAECWGGMSEMMDEESVLCEAMFAMSVAGELDIYGLRPEELLECLEGARVGPPSLSIGCYRSTITADCSPADLETMLLLVNLLFAYPVKPRPEGFETLMQMLVERRKAEERSPGTIFQKRCDFVNTLNHPYYRSVSLQRLQQLDYESACAIYNAKLADPTQWRLIFTGKLPPTEHLVSLLEKYVSNIPVRTPSAPSPLRFQAAVDAVAKKHETGETVTPLHVEFPKASLPWEEVSVPLVDPQCRVLFTSPIAVAPPSPEAGLLHEMKEMLAMSHLWRLLETKLCERLRFRVGKTYNVSVGDSFRVSPPQKDFQKKGHVSISFSCAPDDARDLLGHVLSELDRLREEGFEERDIKSMLEQEKRSFEKALRDNGFWETTISNLYFSRCFQALGKDIERAVDSWKQTYDDSLNNLSVESAKKTLLHVLPAGGVHTVLVMKPEKSRCVVM